MRDDVKRDDMWSEEAEKAEELTAVLESSGPTEAELVTIALLMRLYDLSLALLSHFDRARADEVYEAHAEGKNFNPPVFIPKMSEVGDE